MTQLVEYLRACRVEQIQHGAEHLQPAIEHALREPGKKIFVFTPSAQRAHFLMESVLDSVPYSAVTRVSMTELLIKLTGDTVVRFVVNGDRDVSANFRGLHVDTAIIV